ncbi:MAG: aminopeptidase [Anaerolineae bacterium]
MTKRTEHFALVDPQKIESAVLRMFEINMGLRAGECLLVLSDVAAPEHWRTWRLPLLETVARRAALGRAVADIAAQRFPDCEVSFVIFPSTGQSGTEPPADVADAMLAHDVVVAITSFSLTHTDARQAACQAGARIASMPRFLPEMFYAGGPMDVDYEEVLEVTTRLADMLTPVEMVRATGPDGTEIEFSIEGRPGNVDAGIYREPGAWGNLPGGEAYCVPLEGTAEGIIVVPGGWHMELDQRLELEFQAGLLVDIRGGGRVGEELRHILRPGADEEPFRSRRNLGELGIGTNPNAQRIDITLEAEKIKGTVHMACGDNAHMGGQVSSDYHQDFLVPQASVWLDGKPLMENGRLLVE